MNELITIVINVYNGEKYIKKCLNCITNQTYKNLEILIINDGSTDKTLDICKTYKDKRIKIISTTNQGLSMSRNTGIENAKGKYLYFIDVDDFIEKDTIEYLYGLIKKFNVKMATCKSIDVYDNKINKKKTKEKVELISKEKMLEKNLLSIDNTITIWNKLMKKELFDNIRFENRVINDLAVTYKIILLNNHIVFSNQIKYYYIRNKESISIKKKEDMSRNTDIYKVSLERYENIHKIYPNLLANNVGLLRNIAILYNKKNKNLHKYLDENGARIIYKNIFKFKILFYKMSKKEKIMIIICRIHPKLSNLLYNTYIKIRKRKKINN